MSQFDRLLGILLALQRTRAVPATQLARQFEVSTRTIYRELQTLSALGVPVYTARGHGGGIRLLEGYFLPPLTLSQGEGIVLLVGLTLLQSLHTFPFPQEAQTALQKLLVAIPAPLSTTLMQAEKVIGVERTPDDIFHPEPVAIQESVSESLIITTFLQSILDHASVDLCYRSPYPLKKAQEINAIPLGLFWDRKHWYLVGRKRGDDNARRLWRADRVLSLTQADEILNPPAEFNVQDLLGHAWLKPAMERWQQTYPVVIRLTYTQAQRLQGDWYYRQARFEECADGHVYMTFGEENQSIVFELLRWLGPGAELLEPRAWRKQLQEELQQMLLTYSSAE